MAAKLKSETLALDVIVNANEAQKNINNLGREITDTTFRIKELQQQQALLAKEGEKDSKAYKDLTKEIKLNRDKVKDLKSEQDKLITNLSLEQKTISQLQRQLTDLRKLRNNSIPGSEQYLQYSQKIELVSNRLNELQLGTELTGKSMENLSGRFKNWVATATATAASFAAVTMGIRKAINEYASFDDLLVDVMKTTNLSKDAVKELNEELLEIDTRTSQEDLLGLSRIAGKLGYDEITEIAEFVRANNQIIVSLNEDLGGNVEETVSKIGKLVDIFKLKELYSTEEAFLKVGSALNELGMASTANEEYMVEFARRLAGVAPLAKVSIDQILGLGAALDQLGQTEEVSSTALSKLFLKLASEAETYSKYAGMSLIDFKNLLEKDFMGAFTKVLQGVRNNANGINELASTLGDLGEDGGRVIGVLGSLANNVDVLTSSMNLANSAMEDGTSITQEYELKNQSAGAQLEKAQKKVKELWIELGEKLWPVMTSGLNIFGLFINVLKVFISFISNNFRLISSLTIAIVAYYTAMQLAAKWTAINTTLIAAKEIVLKGSIIAHQLLTGQITRTAAAQQLLNLRMLANPYGLVAAALAGLVTYLIIGTNKTDKYAEAQSKLNSVQGKAIAETKMETMAINDNLKVIQNSKSAISDKTTAIKKLREIMPNVLKDYSDEQILAGEATKAIKAQAEAIVKRAEARIQEEFLMEEFRNKEKNDQKIIAGFEGLSTLEKGKYYLKGLVGLGRPMEMFLNDVKRVDQETNGAIELYTKNLRKKLTEIQELGTELKTENPTGAPLDNDKTSDSDRKKAYQKELDDAEKHHQDTLKQKALFREDLSELSKEQLTDLAKLEDDYQTKLDAINAKYGESLKTRTNAANQELKKRIDAEDNYVKSILIKKQTEAEAEENAFKERLLKAGLFGLNRESLTENQLKALEILEKEHKSNLAKIDADAIAKEIDARLAMNKDVLTDLRIKHQEELSEIHSLNQAKDLLAQTLTEKELSQVKTLGQARKLIQNKQMLDEQTLLKQQLADLISILQQAESSGNFEGLVMSDKILSEEEKKVIIDRIRELKEQLGNLTGLDKSDELNKDADNRKKVDVLGMSVEDWENLFNNIGTAREKMIGVLGVMNAATQLWGQYNAMVAAKENAQLQKDESANNIKKDRLKKRLDDGLLSQESYNKQVDLLDKDLEKKKAVVARNQAKRERNVALMSAIVNTAKAVTSVLPNFILAAIVGAMGALQVGTIMRTPLPEIPGAESGGSFMDVIREQDGKKFRANSKYNKRGYIEKPTVLVGENGKEWVANNQAVGNPNIKPLFDVLDTAQRNGTINTITLSDIIAKTLPNNIQGRQSGGTFNNSSTIESDNNGTSSLELYLKKSMETMDKLSSKIENMEAKVVLLGKNGFVEKMKEFENLKNNGSI